MEDDKLIQLAREVAAKAHAPYSGFKVGAALCTKDGRVFKGCNVESSSFGATVCAERAALCMAVANGRKSFDSIAIYTDTDDPTPPCGICRQFLMDFSPDMRVICASKTGKVICMTLSELLPNAFLPDQLKKT